MFSYLFEFYSFLYFLAIFYSSLLNGGKDE